MSKLVNVFKLGRLDYAKCLKLQKFLLNTQLDNLNKSLTNSLDTLLLVEHDPPVYTIGIRRAKYLEHELDKLRKLNAHVEFTDRGGLITFHGLGQLVAYPILNLKQYNPSIKWYVSQLEQVIIDLCKQNFNLKAQRLCASGYTGVWVGEAKIAALGVHCKRYITYHGLSLNCNVNLDWFKHIVPCGIEDKLVSSLSNELKRDITVDSVVDPFLSCFAQRFEATLKHKTAEETRELIEHANSF